MSGIDWKAHREVAYGLLGLMPESFGKLTPKELWEMREAKLVVMKAEYEIRLRETAQLAAWLLSPYSDQPLTVDDFIQPPKEVKTAEEHMNEIQSMVNDFGLKEGGQ